MWAATRSALRASSRTLSRWRCLAGRSPARPASMWSSAGKCALPAACWRSSIAASARPTARRLRSSGRQGSIELGSPFKPAGGEWIKIKRGDSVEQLRSPEYDLYRGEIEDMERAVLDGQAPRISLENSRGNVADHSGAAGIGPHRASRCGCNEVATKSASPGTAQPGLAFKNCLRPTDVTYYTLV